MTSGHIRASYGSITYSCWRHWTQNCQDLSAICTPRKFSTEWREMTSRLSRRRSERTKSCCQRSVASLLNSSNCFSTHSTTVHNHIFAMSLLADQVCTNISKQKWSKAAKSLKPRLYTHRFSRPGLRGVVRVSRTKKSDTSDDTDDTSDDASNFLVRGSDGRLSLHRSITRLESHSALTNKSIQLGKALN